jgi:hypothetical protein
MATTIPNNPAQTGPFGTQGQKPTDNFESRMPPKEGDVAKNIEKATSRVPSDVFLWAAVGAMGVSMLTKTARKDHASLFLGQWVAPLLLFGVYNKIVKVAGSDRMSA